MKFGQLGTFCGQRLGTKTNQIFNFATIVDAIVSHCCFRRSHHAEQWTSSSLPTAQKTPTHIPFGQKKDQIRSNCFLNNCFQPLLLQNGFFHRARRSFDRKGEVWGCSNSRPFYLSTDSCAIAAVIQYHGSNCTRVGGKCLLGDVLMRSDRNDL